MRNTFAVETSRPGICDFVPAENRKYLFASKHHRDLRRLRLALQAACIESLLEEQRLLALTELALHSAANCDGDLIELGVYKGGSAAAIGWRLREAGMERPLHLCDTFEGMPRTLDWEFHKQYDFADTSFNVVSESLLSFLPSFPFQFHRGLFSQTLPAFRDCRLSFAHVDADLYQSVREACEFVYSRLSKEGVIIFDDYGAPTCSGAKQAVDEFFADKLEKPTHVSMTSYGICLGHKEFDFHRLLLRRTLPSALIDAGSRAPLRVPARLLRAAEEKLTSPKVSKALAMPFLYFGQKCKEISVKEARSILVLRPDTIGDLILMTPFLRGLRLSNPAAWITLIVDPRFVNIVELCPHVNEILTYNHRQVGRFANARLHFRTVGFARAHLWQRHFDLALLPRWDTDHYHSAFLAHFSKASYRVAYSEHAFPQKEQFNRGYDGLFTRIIDDPTVQHEVVRNLRFLRSVGGTAGDDRLELWLSDQDKINARRRLESQGITSGDLLIAIGPGAGATKRVWSIGAYIELGRKLQREFGARILVVGGPEDQQRAVRIQEELGNGTVNVAGEFTLRQTAALLGHVHLMVANDSGPMHLGAAAGCAVAEISCHPQGGDPMHANSPARFHPWTQAYSVVQPETPATPCTNACEWHEAHCINNVPVDAVLKAAKGLISGLRLQESAKAKKM